MKKMFNIIIILLLIYIAIQFIFGLLVGTHTVEYKLEANGKLYSIKEIFTSKYKTKYFNEKDNNNYYYEVKDTNDKLLSTFKITGDYNGKKEYLTDIKVYEEDNLFCLYPVFKDTKQTLDVICTTNGEQVLYSNLLGSNDKLDAFVTSLQDLNYDHYNWTITNLKTKKLNNIEIYEGNFIDNQYIALWHYKGIFNISKEESVRLTILLNDQYDNNLSFISGNYYVIPNYNKKNSFDTLIKINLKTSTVKNFKLETTISYNSFIQGFAGDDIYIVDKNNNAQYKINVQSEEISLFGDKDAASIYYNGKWQSKTIYDIIDNNLVFGYDKAIPNEVKKYNATSIDNVLGDTDGYYYLYINKNNIINVYRIDKQNTSIKTLLFKVPNITNIKYINETLYFISDDILYIYSDALGLRPLVKYHELLFNKSDMYDVYINN